MGEENLHNHSIDSLTGFIQSQAFPSAFDAETKTSFLQYYRSNGLRLNSTCKAIGVKRDTVKKHMEIDSVFRAAVEEIHADWLEELESVSMTTALNPKSTIERIFQLKCHLPDKYGQEQKQSSQSVVINITGDLVLDAKRRNNALEAEIVSEIESERSKIISTHIDENKTVDYQGV